MPTYYSGIDLHKRTSYLVTVDEEGSVVKEANLKNHPASISAYFASISVNKRISTVSLKEFNLPVRNP